MKIEKNTVATIKLVTGEEVIAQVSNIEGTTITIERPLVIMMAILIQVKLFSST